MNENKMCKMLENGEIVNGIKLFEFNSELDDYLNQFGCTADNYDDEIIVDNEKYIPLYLLFNIEKPSGVYGVVYSSKCGNSLCATVGCGVDRVDNGIMSFNDMMTYLTDETYFIQ